MDPDATTSPAPRFQAPPTPNFTMRRMNAMDATFLYLERPTVYQHTLKIAIANPIGTPDGYSFQRAKQTFGERLHLLPPYCCRILPTPLSIHHPVWIEDPDFDLDFHVRRLLVPAPGGDRELCELISEIASRPLDRTKPLWELSLIEGLANGQVACVSKVHHAVADGVSSAELLESYRTAEEADGAMAISPGERNPVRIPSAWRLMGWALADILRKVMFRLPSLLRAAREARRRRIEEAGGESPRKHEVPKTPFNRALTPNRSFAFFTQPLAEAKEVRALFGTTINGVVLATVAGGLRRYLLRKGALPAVPLVAGMPTSTRTEEERRTWGNRFTTIGVSLRTDVEHPVERLRASHEAAQEAKKELRISAGAREEDWLELVPPLLVRLTGLILTWRMKLGRPPLFNVVVSNVRGPQELLYQRGSPFTKFISVGPNLEGVGLNVTVWSYVDQLNFGLIACREAVPDLWDLASDLQAAFGELRRAAADERAMTASVV